MPKRTPLDWEDLERGLHAAGVSPEEIDAGARWLLAQARGYQLAETRKPHSPRRSHFRSSFPSEAIYAQ